MAGMATAAPTPATTPKAVPSAFRADLPPALQAKVAGSIALLRQALAELAPEKREVLVMSRFNELKYEEIASVLKIEVGTVKVRVYRAMRELSDRFFALCGERAS